MNDSKRDFIIALRRDAELQDKNQVEKMGQDLDALDSSIAQSDSLRGLPWIFYDSWMDEREHGFVGLYGTVTKADWPRLARALADSLENGREITDELLLRFQPKLRGSSFFARLKSLFFE